MPRPRRVSRLTLFYGGLVRAKNVLSMFNSATFDARRAWQQQLTPLATRIAQTFLPLRA